MKRCARCILPETFPGITFNGEGVCNYCLSYKGDAVQEELKARYEAKFMDLIKSSRKNSTYDLIMAYSGGKDSTYTLDIFVSRYKLNVLALTFDNSFMSERAYLNIKKVCHALGIDHQMVRPNPSLLSKVFQAAAKEAMFSRKTLERASTICTCCIGFVKSLILRTAIEKNISFVGFGWSPGQAPVQASVMKTNASLMKMTQNAIYGPLHKIAGDAINPYFLFEEHYSRPDNFPWNIHPLAFLEYNEEDIIRRNKQIGWEKPNDTDSNSTNCLLNAFANHVHKDLYGFHPYVWELANMVRSGSMQRDFAKEKIEEPENQEIVNLAKKRLGL